MGISKLSKKEVDDIEKRLETGEVSTKDVERLIYSIRELSKDTPTGKQAATPKKPATPSDGKVEIFTDGACSGNPGPGGWGAIVKIRGEEHEYSGGAPRTTSNRMELSAAIEALKTLPQGCAVMLTTDSQYLKNGITSWITNWKRNGWRTSQKEPVKNAELWRELDELNQKHTIDWKWVKGHNGHPENERCDELARGAIESLR